MTDLPAQSMTDLDGAWLEPKLLETSAASSRTQARPGIRTNISKPMLCACGVLVLVCAAWAAVPLSLPQPVRTYKPAAASASEPPRPLQLAAFQTPLWVAPIPPPAPPPPPPPPPPLRLQLVAITQGEVGDADSRSALIFDPDQSKLYTVTVGQTINERTITRITDSIVELKDATGTRQLSLRTDRGAGPLPQSPPAEDRP